MTEHATTKGVLSIRHARTHNLQDVSLDIPRDKLIAVTGLSGSGKSSLAFDTIYAEGQRKYVESLSAYARQFLGQMLKPDVESISGLPPTIAIAQQSTTSNPRSTVATTTEIYDYLRLLFARVGTPHCPETNRPLVKHTIPQMVDEALSLPEGTRAMVLAPLVREQKGEFKQVFQRILREGFVRVRVDGEVCEVKNRPALSKTKPHTIEVVVDRIIIKPDVRTRVSESIETALKLSEGMVMISHQPPGADRDALWQDETFSEHYANIGSGFVLPELEPRVFSFNSPHGACSACDGLGTVLEFDPELIVSDTTLSLEKGAVDAWRRSGPKMTATYSQLIRGFCTSFGVSPATPWQNIPERMRSILLSGTSKADEKEFGTHFEGVIPNLKRRWESTESDAVKTRLHAYMSEHACHACGGARLQPGSLAVRIGGYNIHDVTRLSIAAAAEFFGGLAFDSEDSMHAQIAAPILRTLRARLSFLLDVGLGYLTLDRRSDSLSGGEAQRIRLATQVGSGLVGVCYVLDEPTTGLHARDTEKLIDSLRRLTDLGNTVLVVEHDTDTIRAADWIIDVGPGPGSHGGRILVNGSQQDLLASSESITAGYLRGEIEMPKPAECRSVIPSYALEVRKAAENNLKSIDVRFPLGLFCCVTGVSGSGKSTLVNQILLPALKRRLYNAHTAPGKHERIVGAAHIDKIIEIDQSPIGRTPRSNPATYTGVFDAIRELFAKTREAKIRGYSAGRFSFNVKGGRCEACQGQGTQRIEMHFLPDVFVECPECRGTRYSRETLDIRYRGKSIADVLDMQAEEALAFFDSFSAIKQTLQALCDVGLGYLTLGQSSTTLSGGEAQRVKLATELGKTPVMAEDPSRARSKANGATRRVPRSSTLYVLDEPTTGLHFADIHKLLEVLNRLCDAGHSMIVIEHNLDVIRQADWIIDLGPEGGDAGGEIVAEGRPVDVAEHPRSYTAKYLREALANRQIAR